MRTLILSLAVLAAACSPTQPPQHTPPPATTAPATDEPPPTNLRVDHAWVKDDADPAEQAARTGAMSALRAKVDAGQPFVAAWESLGVDGGPWHVAEGESYPSDVLPPDARDLPVGTVSAVLPGNGGQHLFRILGRE